MSLNYDMRVFDKAFERGPNFHTFWLLVKSQLNYSCKYLDVKGSNLLSFYIRLANL